MKSSFSVRAGAGGWGKAAAILFLVAGLCLLSSAPAHAGPPSGIAQLGCAQGIDGIILPDESVLAVGSTKDCDPEKGNPDWTSYFIAKLNPDGSIDQSFGNSGVRTLGSFPNGSFGDFKAYSDDSWILSANGRLFQFTPQGYLDPSFGDNGLLRFGFQEPGDSRIYDISTDDSGRTLVVGEVGTKSLVTRLLADGSPDPSFGTAGETEVSPTIFMPGIVGVPSRVIAAEDGGTLVAGVDKDLGVYVLKLDSSGNLDTSFADSNGVLVLEGHSPFGSISLSEIHESDTGFGIAVRYWEAALYEHTETDGFQFSASGEQTGRTVSVPFVREIAWYSNSRYLAAIGSNGVRGLDRLSFGMSGSIGGGSYLVGPGESKANGVALGRTGPGIAFGTAQSDPCEYLQPESDGYGPPGPRVRGCRSSMVIKKLGGVPFGENGFVSLPEITCEWGESPSSETVYHRCLPPSEPIATKASARFRIIKGRSRKPGLKARINIRPQPSRMKVIVPRALFDKSNLRVTQGGKKLDIAWSPKSTLFAYPDPAAQPQPIVLTIPRGALKRIPKKMRRTSFKFPVFFRGEQFNYRWQKKLFRSEPVTPRRQRS